MLNVGGGVLVVRHGRSHMTVKLYHPYNTGTEHKERGCKNKEREVVGGWIPLRAATTSKARHGAVNVILRFVYNAVRTLHHCCCFVFTILLLRLD